MKIQSVLTSVTAAAATAAVFIGIAGAPEAAASGASFGEAHCSISYRPDDMGGTLTAQAGPGVSGSYSLVVRSATASGDVILNTSGSVYGVPDRWSNVLTTNISTVYVARAGSPVNRRPGGPRRLMDEIGTGTYGDNAELVVDYVVRDRSGRTICRQTRFAESSIPVWGGNFQPPIQRPNRGPNPRFW